MHSFFCTATQNTTQTIRYIFLVWIPIARNNKCSISRQRESRSSSNDVAYVVTMVHRART
jgi:hypothetical protein